MCSEYIVEYIAKNKYSIHVPKVEVTIMRQPWKDPLV